MDDRHGTTRYSGRGLHGRIVESLGVRVVRGDLAPGAIIDLNRLADVENVSRTVVREAVKVLIGKGLLDARPKRGTFVRDRATWNLLDPDVMRWRSVGGRDGRLLQDLDEVRRTLEPVTARLAAARRSPWHLVELEGAYAAMAASNLTDQERVEADVRFHRLIATATGNELLETLSATLEPVQRKRDVLAFEHLAGDSGFLDMHNDVLDGIRGGDPDAAEAAMRALLDAASQDIETIIRRRTEEAGK